MECVARIVNSHKCKSPAHASFPLPVLGRGQGWGETPALSIRLLANNSQQDYGLTMRLALKTGSYSLMHLTVAIVVTYATTQNWRAALAVGLIEPAVQTIAYLIHDRIWRRIEGRVVRKDTPNP